MNHLGGNANANFRGMTLYLHVRALDSIGSGGVNRVTLRRVQKAREMYVFESQMDGERSADGGPLCAIANRGRVMACLWMAHLCI